MKKDPAPEDLALVGHCAVLHGAVEHHHVPGLPPHLQGIVEKLLCVVGVAGIDVGAGTDGSAPVLRGEVSEQGHKLDAERRGFVQDVGVLHGQEVAVVGVVQVGRLALHAWQHRVCGKAGDLGILSEDGVGDVHDEGVLSKLLEDLPLVEQGPHQAAIVVVHLVLLTVFLKSTAYKFYQQPLVIICKQEDITR